MGSAVLFLYGGVDCGGGGVWVQLYGEGQPDLSGVAAAGGVVRSRGVVHGLAGVSSGAVGAGADAECEGAPEAGMVRAGDGRGDADCGGDDGDCDEPDEDGSGRCRG